jgi:hypothetical protein
MEIKINKEIRDYTESMFFGLSLRQSFFSLLAVLSAVGTYFWLKPYLGSEIVSWACVLAAVPLAAMGFFKYNGMTAERIMLVWVRFVFIVPKRLVFKSTNLYYEAVKHICDGEKKK